MVEEAEVVQVEEEVEEAAARPAVAHTREVRCGWS